MTAERPDVPSHGPLAHVLAQQAGVDVPALPGALADLLAVPDDALPAWDAAAADPLTIAWFRGRAEAELGSAWPQPLAHDAARFHGDGDRVAWEAPAFARQERLTRVAVLAAATDEDGWLDEAVDGAVLLCEQSSWCWPAHDDTFRRHDAVLATVADPYLDLGAGEVAQQLAWLDHLLGRRLDDRYPGVRARLRHEARVRVFEPFLRRRDWHWLGLDGEVNNWTPWIHGNVLVAALRLLDGPGEEDERIRVVALVLEGLDRYVASLPDDGAVDEGYAYWWNGACRLLEALDVLTHATGGVLDPVARIPALRETIAFPHRMHLGGDWFVNAADGQARQDGRQPWHSLLRAARRAGDHAAEAFATSHRDPARPAVAESEGLGRVARGISDRAWLGSSPGASPLPAVTWLPSTQMLVARETAGSPSGLAVVAKGGHNAESHNHNDVGGIIVATDGVPVIVDAGRPTYEARTFGAGRYGLWPMRSEWHSVPFVRGAGQRNGRDRAAELVSVTTAGGAAELVLDLSGAYDAPSLASWRRTVRLDRAARVVELHDAWRFDEEGEDEDEDEPTQVRLLLAGEATLSPGSARIVPLDGATPVRLDWAPSAGAALVAQPLDDPMLTSVWGARLVRLDIDVTSLSESTIAVRQEGSGAGADLRRPGPGGRAGR
ncbi:heparinase II/III family protein [Microbacterium betulae]|uniref:Heparinase II/III family protein n=1 Tax=Microbacterium betulae TaxID=2981139 RepID=A0AA97FJG6_9MICO|nr:heparinase II/III family protein [Microbacterium sp. AB]WOF23405.1 heparinase II/III family protein [Microbacterium sp. AB]